MSMIGTRVVRREDPELLTVGGSYVDDLAPADALHATFVRSDMAHALITGVDTAEAAAMPGVVGVFTAADLDLTAEKPGMPIMNQAMTRTWLAVDRVRYVGEPVAVVVTMTREAGVDAAENVFIDYEPLDPVVDMKQAVNNEVVLFPEAGTNVAATIESNRDGDIFADVEVRVDLSFRNHRMTAAPIEPRAAVARWDVDPDSGTLRLTQWSSTQFPHGTRDGLAASLGVDPAQVRVITPDVGGGFGAKGGRYPEDLVVASLARKLERPVRWTETRSENMVGMDHGRAVEFTASIGGTRDGRITAYKLHVLQDSGAYPRIGAMLPSLTQIMACGVYDIDKVDFSATSVVTNTAPVGAYRGAGRPEATAAIERMVDAFAAEVGMDPVEVRRRNFIKPESFPYKTQTGADMDNGEYAAALDAVIDAADYAGLRAEQERRRNDPTAPLLGLGWCSYVEITNPFGAQEFGSVEIKSDGSALVLTGSSAHGQGHHTAFAQLTHDLTGIALDRIEVRHGDTDEVKRGGGTGGSKSLQAGGSAVWKAGEIVVGRAKETAADLLEAAVGDIVLDTDTGALLGRGNPVGVHRLGRDRPARRRRRLGPEPGGRRRRRRARRPTHGRGRLRTRRGDVPVRHPPVGRRSRPGNWRGHRGRSLLLRRRRHHRQPADRRRPGPRRRRLRHRPCPDGGVRLRLRRQPPDRQLHGLRAGVGRRAAELHTNPDGDGNPPKPARRQGHRRVGNHRRDPGRPECRGRRPRPSRRPPYRDPHHRPACVGGDHQLPSALNESRLGRSDLQLFIRRSPRT